MNLEELARIQEECAKKVLKEDRFEKSINTVGGIDVTFEKPTDTPTRAWACIAIIDINTLKPIHCETLEGMIDFPYIPTFLAFRELPLMKKLYENLKIKPDVIFIDGQGTAHPRGCGIASHFGVETDTITVGVAKTKLCGDYNPVEKKRGSYSYLIYKNKIIGAALRTRDKVKPIYVSVGHKISLETAIKLVLKTSIYRIPEPTRLAHNILQKIRKSLF